MSIESKKYVANVEDIRKLTRENVDAEQNLASTRKLYFQALVGTTRAELVPGKSSSREQALVLRAVHDRFYVGVLEVINVKDSPRVGPDERKRRTAERNAKSNFARSAFGTIRRWLMADHDITTLNPATLTEQQLRKETPIAAARRKANAKQAQKRVSSLVEKILAQARQLANANPAEARAVLDSVVTRMTRELFAGADAVAPTNDPSVAAKESRPLKVGKVVFWPSAAPANGEARRERLPRIAA